jgi:siroheme synthase
MQTAIFLMCKENLACISARLIAHGRPPSTPAAVISKGSTPEERIVVSTLADIPGEAASLPSPAMLVVGEVVALRQVLHPGLTDGQRSDRVTA